MEKNNFKIIILNQQKKKKISKSINLSYKKRE